MLNRVSFNRNPCVTVHGSFSLPANLHALDSYVESHNGTVFKTPYLEGFIVIHGFSLLIYRILFIYSVWMYLNCHQPDGSFIMSSPLSHLSHSISHRSVLKKKVVLLLALLLSFQFFVWLISIRMFL